MTGTARVIGIVGFLILLSALGFPSSARASSLAQAAQICASQVRYDLNGPWGTNDPWNPANPNHSFVSQNCFLRNNSQYAFTYEQWDVIGNYSGYDQYIQTFDYVVLSSMAAAEKNRGKKCDSCFGDPVATGMGNKFEEKQEYRGTGAFPLNFSWAYSRNGMGVDVTSQGNVMGENRLHSYAQSITVYPWWSPAAQAYATRPDGNVEKYTLSGSSWVPEADNTAVLISVLDSQGRTIGYERHGDNGDNEQYDAGGQLNQIVNRAGLMQTLSYTAGLLSEVTAPDGRALVMSYTGGLLTRIDLPDGQHLQFAYDSTNPVFANLVSVTYPDNSTIAYRYDSSGGLTGVQDEKNVLYSTTMYDSAGRATGTSLAGGVDSYTAVYQPSADGTYASSVTVTDPLGAKETQSFSTVLGQVHLTSLSLSCSGCTTRTLSSTFDAQGRPYVVTDFAGITTETDYAANGLLNQKIESANQPATKRTTMFGWDTTLRVPMDAKIFNSSTSQPGVLLSHVSWTYNARGQALTQTQIDPVTAATRTSTRTYCEQADITAGTCPLLGLLKAVDGPRTDVTDVTTYTYYATDDSTCTTAPTTCPHRKGDLWKLTDALGHVTQYLKYDGAGRVLSIQDPNGVHTDLTYSPRGWLTQRAVRGAVSADDRITTFAYDAVGQVIQVTQPDNSYVAFTYDAAHRLTDVRDALSNSIHYTLDNAGNRTKEDTKVASQVLVRTLSRVYDGMGLLQQSLNAQNAATAYTYDANNNTKLTTDALGRVAQQDYDPLNRLMHTLQNVGGIGASTTYAYDARDHLTQVTDPKGLNTVYQYDGLDNLTKLTSPDTGITTYTYDTAGNRKTQTDARPITATYTYDALNRMTGITFPGGIYRTFTYDVTQMGCAAGETFSVGRLTQFFNVTGTTTRLCYDRFGNLVRKQQKHNMQAKSFTTRYVYDKAGRVLQIITPTSTTITYTRDAAGRILTLAYRLAGQTVDTPVISNVTYYPFGPVQQLTYANGRTLTRTYDQDYVIASVLSNGPGGLDYSFGRDAVGNLTQLLSATASNNFSYDGLDRLTGVSDLSNSLIAAYAYDGTGNRLSKQTPGGTQTYTYPSTSHRLSAVAGTGRIYDAVGNTTGIGTRSFMYQETDRLANVRNSGVLVKQYAYNALGERVSKSLNGVTDTFYMYDESGHLLGDYDATAARLHDYLWLDDLPVGVLSGATGTVAYLEPDHLNTPRVAVDPVRNVAIWKWPLGNDAFGESAPQQDPDGDGTQFVLNLRLPGQYFDAESGLSYNYFRDYDASTGRYVESDPIGLFGGISTYAYVGGNPLSFVDPFGLHWQFSDSTGQWSYVNEQNGTVTPVGQGYSGTGAGRNNPDMQNVPGVGPTPQGTYTIGPGHYSPNTGPNTMNIDPAPGNNTSRTLLRIHGDNATHDASHGCAIAPPNVRQQINNSNDRILQVVQ